MRYLTDEQVPEPVDFSVWTFPSISLCLVLPVARKFLADGGQAVCLIKPQFEAGRGKVGKKGRGARAFYPCGSGGKDRAFCP